MNQNKTDKNTSSKNIKKSEVIDNSIFENLEPVKHKRYYSYNARLGVLIVSCFITIVAAAILILSSFSIVKLDAINYQEKSFIDYKVYLKENDFFTEEYLGKNMTYVASLIKNIDVDFNYQFDIDRDSSMDVDYRIIGKLSINSEKDGSVFFEKEYTLLETAHDTFDAKSYNLRKNIVIDYDYYNNLANKFKHNYGVDAVSKLVVTLEVTEKSNEMNDYEISNVGTISLNIPLSERAVNVNLDYKDVNKQQKIAVGKKIILNKRYRFGIGVICFALFLFFIARLLKLLLKLNNKKSKYDLFVSKILKEYDRLIVNTRTAPNTDGVNVIKIDTFEELLDARDNVKGAIKYFVVHKHQKCIFYFTHNDDLYLLTIKAVDLENENNEKTVREL